MANSAIKARNWCATVFGTPEQPLEGVDPTGWSKPTYVCWQKEKCPKTNVEHLQLYCEFSSNITLAAVKKIHGTAHWEPRRGSQHQAIEYCKKDDTRVAGPWEVGTKKEQGKRTDLGAAADVAIHEGMQSAIEQFPDTVAKYHKGLQFVASESRQKRMREQAINRFNDATLLPWQEDLHRKLQEPPDDRKIHWYWESVGNVGKTWFCKYLMAKYNAIVLDCSKKQDLAYLLKDHDGPIVLFNITRTMEADKMGYIYAMCESIKDDIVISTKYECRHIHMGPQHVVVFANEPPDMTKWSEDRYHVVEIKPVLYEQMKAAQLKKPELKRIKPTPVETPCYSKQFELQHGKQPEPAPYTDARRFTTGLGDMHVSSAARKRAENFEKYGN